MRNHRIERFSGSEAVLSNRKATILNYALLIALLAATAASYWPTMEHLFAGWEQDDYSAGKLVPFIVAFLIWRDRKKIKKIPMAPCWFGGGILLFMAECSRFYGFLSYREALERCSIVLMVAGLVLLITGTRIVRVLGWHFMFLLLMIPLPGFAHTLISSPLQTMASAGSVFVLEAFVNVSRQGNVIVLNGTTQVGVAEACSGLRMLTAFIIVAAFIAFVVKRSRWHKVALVISSIPVAIVCNIVRIVVTAMVMLHINTETANKLFHDFAGLVMMPVAVMILFGELWLMDQLIVQETQAGNRPGKNEAGIVSRRNVERR